MRFVTLLLLVHAMASSAISAENYVIENVNLVPMTEEVVLADRSVQIAEGRIQKICQRSADCSQPGSNHIDGRGKYLIPGLIDMHAHTEPGLIPGAPAPLVEMLKRVQEQQLKQYVLFGVTTTRDTGGGPQNLKQRERIRESEILGPRIYSSKLAMDGEPRLHPATIPFADPGVAADYVRQTVAEGYDMIKIYSTLQQPVFDAIIDAAAESDTPVVGHVPMPIDFEYVLQRGLRSVEHLSGFGMYCAGPEAGLQPTMDDVYQGLNFCTPEKVASVAAMVAKYPVWVDPTLIVQDNVKSEWDRYTTVDVVETSHTPPILFLFAEYLFDIFKPRARAELNASRKVRLALVKALSDADVPLLIGTDTMASGYNVHQELALFVEAGLTPYQTLEAATAEPARYFGKEGEFGTIVEGSSADLLLLDANPLEDIGNAGKIAGVMLRGQWLSRERIQQERDNLQTEYAADRELAASMVPAD